MPKKRNVKKIILIVLVLFIIILSVRGFILDAIEKARLAEKEYTSVSDFESVKEIAEYMGCTYIKEQESTGDNYDIDIYLKFKYPLYTEDISNEDYYYQMIALILGYLDYQNIRLIDEESDILIAVKCNRQEQELESILINGDSNYFIKQATLKSIKNYQVLNAAEIDIQAEELKTLISNRWDASKINFGTKESTFNNYEIYFDEGIEVKIVGKKVFNIVFTEKYNKPVINNITVNTPFEEIEKILGNPAFNHKDYRENTKKEVGYIGYKGKEIYVFFSENEISIYRVEEADTSTGLAEAIQVFNGDGELRRLVSSITDLWPDYDFYGYDENSVILKYSLKGIRLAFTPREAGVYIYNNFKGYIADGVTINNIIKNTDLIPSNVNLKIDEDLVDKYEENRIMIYNNNNGNILMGDEVDCYTSEFKIYLGAEGADFISLTRNYPNITLKKNINTFITISDTEFVFDDREGNVYKYNAGTNELTDLSEDSSILAIANKKFMYVKGKGLYLYDLETKKLQQALAFENEITGLYNYNDVLLIIGISHMGIYQYNIQTNELKTLTQGQGEYKITTIFEDKIFYDDTLVMVK